MTWSFDMEEALATRRLSPEQVIFAASYLQGNAKVWFVHINDEGRRTTSWIDLKSLLSVTLGPAHDQERTRFQLLATKQEGALESYIVNFSSLALMTPDLDNQTKAVIFTRGLVKDLKKSVLQQHPVTLQDAIRAARCAEQVAKLHATDTSAFMFAATNADIRCPLSRLTAKEHQNLIKEQRSFRCCRPGHFARFCKGPNINRQ